MIFHLVALSLSLVTLGGDVAARPAPPRTRPEVSERCVSRLEAARDELLRRGFAPTDDKNTAKWLQVRRHDAGVVSLELEMRSSADGPATFYDLRVDAPADRPSLSTRWQHHRGKFCCDEHAAREDRLYELRWTRAARGLRAQVQIVEFEAAMSTPAVIEQRDLFRTVAQAAGDDCLAAVPDETPAPAGPLATCTGDAARSWVTVRDHRKALAFIAALKGTSDEFTEGGPFDCGLEVAARCGPDLDGDGKRDLVVRARWSERYPRDGAEDSDAARVARCHQAVFRGPNSPHASLFVLLTREPRSPLGTALLLWDETGAGRDGATVAFTRWRDQPALRLVLGLIYAAPEGAYTEKRERIVVVRDGQLVVVGERQLDVQR